MDNTNSKLVEILDKIQYAKGVNLDEIAKKISVTRPYLSKAKTSGNVDNLIGLLKEHYKDVLEPSYSVKADRDPLAHELYVRMDKAEAAIELLLSMALEVQMKSTGQSLVEVQMRMDAVLKAKLDIRFEERQTQQGGGQ